MMRIFQELSRPMHDAQLASWRIEASNIIMISEIPCITACHRLYPLASDEGAPRRHLCAKRLAAGGRSIC